MKSLRTLTDQFRGEVLRPEDPGYDAARVVWNGMVDRRPALIVRPTSTDDVATAVRFARARHGSTAARCSASSTTRRSHTGSSALSA